jgi:tetratricopeptide (TPR) repeat protein
LEEAAKLMEEVRRIQERLADRHHELPEYRQELATTCSNLALLLEDLPGRAAEAEAAYEEARRDGRQLAEDHPDVPQYRRQLARTELNLGGFCLKKKRVAEAEAAWKAAVENHRQLIARHADAPEDQIALAVVLDRLGGIYSQTARPKEAGTAYREAIGLLEKDPSVIRKDDWAKTALRNAHWGMAEAMGAQGEYRHAAAELDRALALDSGSLRDVFLRRRAEFARLADRPGTK